MSQQSIKSIGLKKCILKSLSISDPKSWRTMTKDKTTAFSNETTNFLLELSDSKFFTKNFA